MLRNMCSLAWDGFGITKVEIFFCVLAGMGWVWSTQVKMHFVTSSLDTFSVHPGLGGDSSTYADTHFLSSRDWEWFGNTI